MAVLSLGSLPLGYRFKPTDAELVDHYLRLKINGDDENSRVIREIDVCKHEPWDLPDLSAIPTKDLEWFFFCPRDIKYPSGNRLNRATHAGYWKATGKDRQIKLNEKLIGMKKTLVFYIGRAPKGKRTHWVIHEYRTTLEELDGTHPGQVRRDDVALLNVVEFLALMFHESAFVLCRLFNKQDETIEDSNLDDSPTAVKSSPADVESELEMPQDSPSLALLAGPSVDHETKHRVIDLPANEVNLQQGNDSTFDYPLMYPLSLPLPLQIKEEMCPSGQYQFNCSRLSVARGTDDNGGDITSFLDSILSNGNDGNSIEGAVSEQFHPMDFSLADEGSLAMFGNQAVDFGCSEAKLDENVLKSCWLVEHDMKDRNFSSIVGGISEEAPSCQPDSESPIETRIRIRPRPNVEVTSPNVAAQGDALRRLRVQRRLQIGPTVCRVYPRVSEQSNEDQKSKILDTEETRVIEEEEQPEVVPSEEARAKDDVPRSVNRGGWSSSAYTFLTQRKGLLPLCSSIHLFRFFTLLVLSLSLIGALFWSSSSSSSQY